jgi:hypothetical protein
MYLIELKQFNIWKINSKTCSANALVFSSSKFEFVTKVNPSKVRIGTKRSSIYTSPQNENLNLLVRIKFLNLFLYSSLKINWSEQSFTGLGSEDLCSREDCYTLCC